MLCAKMQFQVSKDSLSFDVWILDDTFPITNIPHPGFSGEGRTPDVQNPSKYDTFTAFSLE